MIFLKKCNYCGKKFDNRRKWHPRGSRFISYKQFSKTKCCSHKCGALIQIGVSKPKHTEKWKKENSKRMKKRHALGLMAGIFTAEIRRKMSESRIRGIREGRIKFWNKGLKYFLGEKAYNWKGDKVGYHGLHRWVISRLGKPQKCSSCQTTTARKFEWCNISHKYKRDLIDWIRLCTKCHRNYDYGNLQINTTKADS